MCHQRGRVARRIFVSCPLTCLFYRVINAPIQQPNHTNLMFSQGTLHLPIICDIPIASENAIFDVFADKYAEMVMYSGREMVENRYLIEQAVNGNDIRC